MRGDRGDGARSGCGESPASVYGVFTRAEEVGFIGAIQLAKSKQLLQDVTVVSLETSAELPPAKIGAGPIVRVGDRTSVFDGIFR
jgi:putative aminopeptidase FrvX